jgi:hypothetical protein
VRVRVVHLAIMMLHALAQLKTMSGVEVDEKQKHFLPQCCASCLALTSNERVATKLTVVGLG